MKELIVYASKARRSTESAFLDQGFRARLKRGGFVTGRVGESSIKNEIDRAC
jgi:hypothetical protein